MYHILETLGFQYFFLLNLANRKKDQIQQLLLEQSPDFVCVCVCVCVYVCVRMRTWFCLVTSNCVSGKVNPHFHPQFREVKFD